VEKYHSTLNFHIITAFNNRTLVSWDSRSLSRVEGYDDSKENLAFIFRLSESRLESG